MNLNIVVIFRSITMLYTLFQIVDVKNHVEKTAKGLLKFENFFMIF